LLAGLLRLGDRILILGEGLPELRHAYDGGDRFRYHKTSDHTENNLKQ
jgi:hypothetical protein